MGYIDGPTRTYPNNSALGKGIRVIMSAGYLVAAGSTDVELGTMEFRTLAGDEVGTVRLRTATGTQLFVASGAITAFNPCYAAASGKVASSGTILMGVVQEAASADGDIIEVLRRQESSDSSASGGTTGSAFLVDSDATTPKIELASQTGGTGDYKVTIKPAATLTANRVVTIPDAATQVMVGDTATQTLTNKTLTAPVVTNPVETFTPGASTAAAGSSLSDAGALPNHTSRVYPTTAADDTKGVKVHSGDKITGNMLFIGNGVANKILKVYGPSGATINGGSADAAFSSASGKGVVMFCLDSTGNTWLAW